MNKASHNLLVYSREGCHLCEIMLNDLKKWQKKYNFDISVIDIDADIDTQKKYAARVPVLVSGDIELCEYHLAENTLISHFQALNSC